MIKLWLINNYELIKVLTVKLPEESHFRYLLRTKDCIIISVRAWERDARDVGEEIFRDIPSRLSLLWSTDSRLDRRSTLRLRRRFAVFAFRYSIDSPTIASTTLRHAIPQVRSRWTHDSRRRATLLHTSASYTLDVRWRALHTVFFGNDSHEECLKSTRYHTCRTYESTCEFYI